MAKTIYLLQFNNYFNRVLRGPYATADQYWDTAGGGLPVAQIKNMSLWNPNDGVDTEITSNVGLTAVPDYALVCDNDTVLQRWYVTEARRIAGTQYKLVLHRDLIADNKASIMSNVNNYVERGWCDVSNDAIYNEEPLTFNQIKTKQHPMWDRTMCPWIVMYFTPNKTIDGKETAFPDGSSLTFIDPSDSTKKFIIQYKYRSSDVISSDDSIIKLPDAPYAMMALPYKDKKYYNGSALLGTITKDDALKIAQETSRKYSSGGWLMDIQMLPYCPCREIIRSDGDIDLSKAKAFANVWYDDASASSPTNKIGGVICCSKSSFTTSIYSLNSSTPFTLTVADIKRDNLVLKARMVSPNGNGVFEFSPAKMVYANNATVGFEATCTYMPYQPYIKVAPKFARLYGGQYFDTRGLICGGDFSLPQISDSWEAYQINNKNYQAMFNRQIESLELQQKVGTASDIAGAVSGLSSGVAGGAVSGSLAGGPIGSLVGGIAGGSMSLIGGTADVVTNAILRSDQREAMIEQHQYQLQNIQALPYSITKVNTFNIDNLYVPYIEIYDCSEYEASNLDNFLKLRGYTINRYGKLEDYVEPNATTWVKGVVLRLDSLSDDAHYAAAIADEVSQGFYITSSV